MISFLIMQFREVKVEEEASSHSAPFVTQCSQSLLQLHLIKSSIGFGPAAQRFFLLVERQMLIGSNKVSEFVGFNTSKHEM